MEREEGSLERWAGGSGRSALAERGDSAPPPPEWANLAIWARWFQARGVLLAGLGLIVISVIWKAQFLSQLYFRQDDFHLLDRAIENPLDWRQLSFIGAGHLIPGPYLVAWLIARISLYSWPLASAASLVFAAAACLAALRLLRTLFGDHPGILIPLIVYLVCPLTFPDLGIWSSALESVPLQLATFMALTAHIHYVRTGRARHIVSTSFWLVFGLFFFEKGLVIPLLLFGVTSGFLMGGGSWLANARRCAVRYWRTWLPQLVLLAGYAVVLKVSLRTSVAQPGSPGSASRVLTFASGLMRDTFVPGAVGGPWHWFPVSGASYSFTAAPAALSWLSWIAAGLVVVVSLLYRQIAWRAWAILAAWLVFADMIPVILGRISDLGFDPVVLGLESRYVADAVPVLAICLGLAFWPLATAEQGGKAPRAATVPQPVQVLPLSTGQVRRSVAAMTVGAFVLCSLWSVEAYRHVTTGAEARGFILNAQLAMKEARPGTLVVDNEIPPGIVLGSFGKWAHASTVIGDMAVAGAKSNLVWIRVPSGVYDNLRIFGIDGRLHLAQVIGTASLPRPAGQDCWKAHGGQVQVPLYGPIPTGPAMLRIGYLWYSQFRGLVTVRYGSMVRQVQLKPGLNSLYLPVDGGARSVIISGFGKLRLCVGDAQAGILEPSGIGAPIPAVLAIP